MREVRVAAAQMGPIQKQDSRGMVVSRMIKLMEQAKAADADFIVYPELTLTTFFPRHYMEDQNDVDFWFETDMPNNAILPLFKLAQSYSMAMTFGYAELTSDRQHFNTSIHVDKDGKIVGKYRKVHLPGHSEFDPERAFQHLEKRYFLPGNLGFRVYHTLNGVFGLCICNDRRWPETYRVMGLQGVEMITLGYNTPSTNSQKSFENVKKRMFHSELVMQSGAYQNSTWVVGVAKAGKEDGHPMFGGSIIVNPDGEIVARASSEDDELIVHTCNLDDTTFGKKTIFDFSRHRRIEHYQLITSQIGVILPKE